MTTTLTVIFLTDDDDDDDYGDEVSYKLRLLSCLICMCQERGRYKYSSTFDVWIGTTIETGLSMWRESIGPTKEQNS